MQYRNLGRAGVKVAPIILGTAYFGTRVEVATTRHLIDAALDAGINVIDTANSYTEGQSETIIGAALKGRRDRVVLASKVHFPRGEGPNDRGNSRYHIMAQVEASLRRLQTDRIDLYQLHRPDPTVPIEESLRGAGRSAPAREGRVLRHFELRRLAALCGAVDERPPRASPYRVGAAVV